MPEGWELWNSEELDFNEDGITDYVGVLQEDPSEDGKERIEKENDTVGISLHRMEPDGSGCEKIGQTPKE